MSPNRLVIPIILGAVLAATASTVVYAPQVEDGTWEVKQAYFVPNATSTAHATDYATLTLATGSDTLGAINTSTGTGATWTAGTPVAISISSSAGTTKERAKGTALKLTCAQSGSGVAVNGHVYVVLERVRTSS